MRFLRHTKTENILEDAKIITALKQALADYEDGAIIECRDVLKEIVDAITEFDIVEAWRK